jgi:Tol biopolymer transport system component
LLLSIGGCSPDLAHVESATPSPASPRSEPSLASEESTRTIGAGTPLANETVAFTYRDVLYTADVDGSDRRAITDFPGAPYPYGGPYWSPDGRRLIIRTETKPRPDGNGSGYIFRVDADGSHLINLSAVSGSNDDAMPGWSPDGRQIVYTATKPADHVPTLYVMNADGTEPRRLAALDFEAQYPAWSSQGWIAFTGVVDGNFDIYSIRLDGSGLQRLTEDPAQDNWPTISPDSTAIAFSSNRDGADGIWVMNADGTDPHQLAEGGEPHWSPDGRYIAFDCGGVRHASICAIRPDGSDLVRLFARAGFPALRP